MNDSKIRLSEEEMQLVNNSQWILTKHGIIDKVYLLMGAAAEQMQGHIQELHYTLPEEAVQSAPKISKGENYGRLPYTVLDYPRVFSREHVFAVRSFFWWGKYFTVTLHLKGKFLQLFSYKLEQAIHRQQLQGFYISVEGDEFNFDLEKDNYYLQAGNGNRIFPAVAENQFFKISRKISFDHWDTVQEKLMETFHHFMALITA